MPVSALPACVADNPCGDVTFPQAVANCNPEISAGGVNDVYVIPCDATMSETNILDTAWWQGLIDDGELAAIGPMIGSIARGNVRNVRVASCQVEQPVSITWLLTVNLRLIDKTSAKSTHDQIDALLTQFGRFQVLARMCDGDNTVLPIGAFTTSEINWVVPDNFEEEQVVTFVIAWKQLGLPRTYSVSGLSAIVPKAQPGLPPVGSSNS